jgi:hypothetical protein
MEQKSTIIERRGAKTERRGGRKETVTELIAWRRDRERFSPLPAPLAQFSFSFHFRLEKPLLYLYK